MGLHSRTSSYVFLHNVLLGRIFIACVLVADIWLGFQLRFLSPSNSDDAIYDSDAADVKRYGLAWRRTDIVSVKGRRTCDIRLIIKESACIPLCVVNNVVTTSLFVESLSSPSQCNSMKSYRSWLGNFDGDLECRDDNELFVVWENRVGKVVNHDCIALQVWWRSVEMMFEHFRNSCRRGDAANQPWLKTWKD